MNKRTNEREGGVTGDDDVDGEEEDDGGENEMITKGKTELKIKQPTKETDD